MERMWRITQWTDFTYMATSFEVPACNILSLNILFVIPWTCFITKTAHCRPLERTPNWTQPKRKVYAWFSQTDLNKICILLDTWTGRTVTRTSTTQADHWMPNVVWLLCNCVWWLVQDFKGLASDTKWFDSCFLGGLTALATTVQHSNDFIVNQDFTALLWF